MRDAANSAAAREAHNKQRHEDNMYTAKFRSYDIDLELPEGERWAEVIKREAAPHLKGGRCLDDEDHHPRHR